MSLLGGKTSLTVSAVVETFIWSQGRAYDEATA